MIVPADDIKDMTIPWLFQSLRTKSKTGTVIFARETVIKKTYFQGGDIIFASSNLEEERLGEFLLRTNKITQAQFDASAEMLKKTGKKQGAILVELGFISPQDLVSGVKLQVKQIVLSLFGWRDGRYIFDESPLPSSDIIPLQMSTGNLILDGVRRLDWKVVRKSLPPLKTKLRPAADPSLLFQSADLEQDHRSVLSFVDGAKSIEELCSLSGMGDFNTLKAIYVLLALKMVEKGEIKAEDEKLFVREVVRETVTAGQGKPKEQEPMERPDGSGQASSTAVTKQMIDAAFDAMKKQNHYEVLGVNVSATPKDVKKAYFRLAKIYHPDRHFEPEMSGMKDKLAALFTRIHNAYEALTDPALLNSADRKPVAEFEEKRPEEYVENYAEKTGQAAAYFNAGMKDFKVGNFWGAADSFAWATRLDPVKSSYFHYYGMSLSRIPRRSHEAEENLRKAIEIDPLNPEYYLDLGSLYLRSGLKARALDVYDAALAQNPASEKIKEAIKSAGGNVPSGNEGVKDKR